MAVLLHLLKHTTLRSGVYERMKAICEVYEGGKAGVE